MAEEKIISWSKSKDGEGDSCICSLKQERLGSFSVTFVHDGEYISKKFFPTENLAMAHVEILKKANP